MTLQEQYDQLIRSSEDTQSVVMERAIHKEINQFFSILHPEVTELVTCDIPLWEEEKTKELASKYKDKPAVMLMDQDAQVFQYICWGNVIGKAVLGFQGSCRMSLDKIDGSIRELLIRKDGTVTQL